MPRRLPLRGVLTLMGAVALCECSAKYLVSGTVASADGDPLPGVLVAPRLKCGGDAMPAAYSKHTDADGGYQSGFAYASDDTAVEFTKADYKPKCVDLAPLWKRDCRSADGGVADRCATLDVTLAPVKPKAPGVEAPTQPPAAPPAQSPPAEPTETRPAPMTD